MDKLGFPSLRAKAVMSDGSEYDCYWDVTQEEIEKWPQEKHRFHPDSMMGNKAYVMSVSVDLNDAEVVAEKQRRGGKQWKI
jgi:hypothetical protein